MKIVMLCDLYDERLQYQENLLGRYYVKHGHEVTVLAATFDDAFDYYADRYDPRSPRREYWDGGVKVIKLPYQLNVLNKLRRFAGVAEILRSERPDLIFVHDIHLNLREAAAYKRRHPACRVIMDYHADASNSANNLLSLHVLHGIIRKGFLYRYKWALDAIHPIVPAGADFLHDVYGIPRDEMELLPLGADTDLAASVRASSARVEIRERLGIPADALAIFTGGKLTALKRTHQLVEAFLELSDPQLHLVIVGEAGKDDHAYRDQLDRLIAAHPRIHRVGWVHGTEVYRYMAACDLAVFPASQSVLWQQSLSMGLPLIVGQVGVQDSSYMNIRDNMAILPEPRITPEGIAAVLAEWTSDRATLARRSRAALEVTDELLNYDRIVARTLAGLGS